uniref:Uncharacterized protein n=1 Tax=Branchiostoma floridae TaxID=7739 RepID=C3YWT3_BRAFL|eukprot:XP_002599315.1 hypothetical protein BRAFLDRAFT_64329 [Branchiostoma floridae]
MAWSQIVLAVGVALTSLPALVLSCKVVDWQPMSFPEQVAAAQIVVHARVLDKVNGTYGHWPYAYRGVLRVYCVFKGGPLPASITVDEMGRLTSCHHTKVDIGEDYILLLKRDGGMFLPDEVNYLSVAFPADQDHFDQSQGWSAASCLVVGLPEKNPSGHLVMTHHMTSKGQASVTDDSSNPWQTIIEL